MNIENELIAFIDSQTPSHSAIDKDRNIEIIAYFYGFRSSSWPTLDETAEHYGLGTRERVRQIVKKYFVDRVTASDIPSIDAVRRLIERKRYWLHSELEEGIEELRLAGDNFSITGLFNLMNDLKISHGYEIYTPDLKKATRWSIHKFEENFIIRKSDNPKVKSLFGKAKRLPGRCGIARLDYLESEAEYTTYRTLIENLVKFSPTAWVKQDNGILWYLFEGGDNTLINYSEKVFSVIDKCETERLAETYRNALDARTYKHAYPSTDLITDYLRTSMAFENIDDVVSFTGKPTALNEIESDVVQYLKANGDTTYPEIRQHLLSLGYKVPSINKSVFTSPFVYVDRSEPRQHRYSLVGSPANIARKSKVQEHDRYGEFLARLRKLGKTDEIGQQRTRKEQSILQQWLFEGKTQEICAICNNKYAVSALAAAHKKKRSECNEAERLDPYIVMPVCLFGCDFLYENRHIVIEDGIVKEGLPLHYANIENEYIKKIVGKKVSEEWLKGQKSYFPTLDSLGNFQQ